MRSLLKVLHCRSCESGRRLCPCRTCDFARAGKQRGLIRRVPCNVHIDKRVWLTAISPGGRAAGLTDARNFILTVPVNSESLPRSTKLADGQRSLLKKSSATLFNVRGTANTHMGPTPARWWMSLTSRNDCGLPYVDASCGRADPMKRCVADTRSYCNLFMASVQGFTPSRPI